MASASPAVQDDLNPTRTCPPALHTATAGYNPGQKKSLQEYAALDAEDESLRRWKESLGISTGAGALDPNAPKLTIHSLSLVSDAIASGSITLQLDQPGDLERASKTPLQSPEGIEYAVAIRFTYVCPLTQRRPRGALGPQVPPGGPPRRCAGRPHGGDDRVVSPTRRAVREALCPE